MDPVQFLPLLAIVVIFWLMVVRPASRRQKEVQRLQASLAVGQRVMLASGIFGTIVSLTDDRVLLELAPGVQVEAVRGAVTTVEQGETPIDGVDADGDSPSGH